jgi:two-component system phosphate regulon sensor histidine kinase PhoR
MQTNSPRSLSIYISFFVSLFSVSLLVLIFWYQNTSINLWMILMYFALTQIITFILVYFTLERFIYHKIKLLYRATRMLKYDENISGLKLDMKKDVLGDVSKDVTKWMVDQHKTIDLLHEREKFRKEFIGNLAHELKTPVFSIQGYILTLLEGGLEDKEINRLFLERAANSVERITNLLEDLDSISKLESGKLNIDKKRFNLNELLNEVIADLEWKSKKKNISIVYEDLQKKETWVFADRAKITQVLTNLLINAISYSEEGKKIKIRTNKLDNKILIDVIDQGVGIRKEDVHRIFERFYRVDKSRARNKGGTGLGLAIVKHIIEAHGESITVRSIPEQGSTFTFSLDSA